MIEIETTRGCFSPYFGSRNVERLIHNAGLDVSVMSIASEVKRLIMLPAWTQHPRLNCYKPMIDSTLNEILDKVDVQSFDTTKDENVYLEGGTIDHRLSSAHESRAYLPNQLMNASLHFRIDTGTLSMDLKSEDRTNYLSECHNVG